MADNNRYNRRQMQSSCGCGDCKTAMNRLRAVDFALTETVLYLDAYPNCKEALEFYCQLKEQRKKLLAAYEGNCSPITALGNESDTWEWVCNPWPWEADAN